jgi:N-acetylglucosamine-6-sulfatase
LPRYTQLVERLDLGSFSCFRLMRRYLTSNALEAHRCHLVIQAGTADFFPTFTDLAGIQTPRYVDGRSLRPLLEGSTSTWRTAILLESAYSDQRDAWFYGIRTGDGRKYLEYEGGFRELYDLNADPYELKNSYNAATPPVGLASRLEALKSCTDATTSCRQAENGP